MGMFDYVNFEMDCPKCGRNVSGFQTKDLACQLDTVEPDGLINFYSSCPGCKTWIEFVRQAPEVQPRDSSLTVADIEAMGFVMKFNGNG